MPTKSSLQRLERLVRGLAAVVGLVVALAVPAVVGVGGYVSESEFRAYEARLAAERVATYAYVQGPSWRFSDTRLMELITFVAPKQDTAVKIVRDDQGQFVARSGPEILALPLRERAEIVAGGKVVGSVEVSVSLAPLAMRTLIAFLAGIVLGISVFGAAYWYPVRALRQTMSRLDAAQNNLREMNETLERRVQQRTADLEAARAAADQANLAKSRFLANMSHEIRTPLNGVLGMMDIMLGTEMTPEQRGFGQRVRASGEALLGIINDILDISRIEAGKVELEQVEFSPRETIDKSIGSFVEIASVKGLQLTATIADGIPARIVGDPARLGQMLTNLIGNAIKFTLRGGVALRAETVERGDGWATIRIEVEDTGIGIAAEEQARVFDAFAQADSSTTRRFGGSGLGLAIVRDLVKLHGGEIGVDSAPGKGARFWFTLPRLRVVALAADDHLHAAPAPAAAPTFDAHVLVVEDNLVNREVAREMLLRLGCRVDAAENGEEALVACAATTYDLVFMDCQMPILDGFAATAALRAREKDGGKRLPIVALTANAFASDRDACFAAGMDGFIAKPFTRRALADVLGRHLRPVPPAARARAAAMATSNGEAA